jgi:DNA polymerase-3 subunit gamma/tau
MAKLGGEQTELLQISADERARAARTALLFTEEELTRNLQIVLRTFDDLNYRQEQRFHLELGLLKLIHAQRLLPIEELLSSAGAGTSTRGAVSTNPQRPAAVTPRPVAPTAPAPRSATPSLSPPVPAGGWNSASSHSVSTPEQTAVVPRAAVIESSIAPAASAAVSETVNDASRKAAPLPSVSASATAHTSDALKTEGALARQPEVAAANSESPTVEALRQAIVSALAAAGHSSASQLLGAGTWTIDGSNLRMEAPGLGKKMLSLTVNPAAEKIIRQELQRLGGPPRFLVVPGSGAVSSAGPVAAPAAGSIQEAALTHPLVQRAKEIFKAEVRSVVDLRQK